MILIKILIFTIKSDYSNHQLPFNCSRSTYITSRYFVAAKRRKNQSNFHLMVKGSMILNTECNNMLR